MSFPLDKESLEGWLQSPYVSAREKKFLEASPTISYCSSYYADNLHWWVLKEADVFWWQKMASENLLNKKEG